jgi:outer membrane protein assembly factor BamB
MADAVPPIWRFFVTTNLPALKICEKSPAARIFQRICARAAAPFSLIATASAISLAGCASPPVAAPPVADVQYVPAGSFVKQWEAPLDLRGAQVASMTVRKDDLFLYTTNNDVYVLNRKAGTLEYIIGEVTTPGDRLRPPVVLKDQVIFPTTRTLERYSKRGRLIQSVELGFNSTSNAVGDAENVFVGIDAPGGRIAEYDLSEPVNNLRWMLVTGPILATPAAGDGLCIAASGDGVVHALTADRAAQWPTDNSSFATGGPIVADIVLDAGGVYVASTDSRLYVLEKLTGHLRWQYFSPAPLREAPMVTHDMVYLPVSGLGVVGLSKSKGAYNRMPLWNCGDATEPLAADADLVYLATTNGALMAVDKKTGAEKFRSAPTGFTVFAPNSVDAMSYCASADGHVYAISPATTAGTVGAALPDANAPATK